jgi:hypothetical protein
MLEVCLWMMRRRIPPARGGLLAHDHLDVAAHSHFWPGLTSGKQRTQRRS